MTSCPLLTDGLTTHETEWLATGLAIADHQLRREVKAEADALGLAIVLDAAEPDPRRVREEGLKLLIVDAGPGREPLEARLRRLKLVCPDTLVAVVHTAADAEIIMTGLRAGADEFVFPPLAAGLRTALAHLQVKLGGQRPAAGRVLGVVSAKGGCGATTIACHLALALERVASGNVLLADLNLDNGLVGFLTSAQTPYSMIDAARNTHRLDHSFFKGLVSSRTPRLDILPMPAGGALQNVPWESLREALRTVRSMYGWLILDLGSGFNAALAAVLPDVDDLFVVWTPDLPALYQGKQLIRLLLELGCPRSRLRAVFNRLARHRDFTSREIRDFLGLGAQTEVRDCSELAEAYAEGKLAAANTELGRSMTALAAELAGHPPAAPTQRRAWPLKLLWAS